MNTEEILKFWFQNTNDNTTNAFWFDKTLDKHITDNYKELVDSITINNYQEFIHTDNDKMALIIIGDQFTRNIYRDSNRTKNDIWALKLALNMIENNKDLSYQLNYRFFILLPLRHAKQSKLLDIVRNRIALYSPCNTLIKFYNNTIMNYAGLVDTIMIGSKMEYKDVFNDILEKYDKTESTSFEVYNTCKVYNNIALSLSGGVDSMVLFNALKRNNIHFVAIHIEYINRPEARLEREFLEYYCYQNGIKLYYRTIDYISRDDNRELFETETRKARFNLYKYVLMKEKLNCVMLGHHMGDIVENVFTNIIKGKNLNDIVTMREYDRINDIDIMRPFIKFNKADIITVAHSNMIPYFLNSTPTWSCRGVLRDNVIPVLQKQFGNFEQNIIKFAESCYSHSKFYNDNNKINETIMDYGSKVIYGDFTDESIEKLLLDMMHRNGYHMVSHKLKDNFIKWLKSIKSTQIDLGKNIFCYYRNNYLYFVNYTKIIKEQPKMSDLMVEFDNYIPPKIKNV
jgi:tRNA(Ile)-lysidine synthetase-like protein